MLKKIFLTLVFFCFSTLVHSEPHQICDASTAHPCVVQDTDGNDKLSTIYLQLKHFRDAKMLAAAYKGDKTGLANLWLSGGAAFSQNDWSTVYTTIKNSDHEIKNIIDLDLRQETHGYLNGNAINLTEKNDWINLNKNLPEVLQLEKQWLDFLSKQSAIENVLTPNQFKAHQYANGKTIMVKSISSEKNMVEAIGFNYMRLAVTDHMGPRDSEVDHFLLIVKNMPANTWLHIHCRGGDGRTTTFMAMFDMLNNAKKVAFKDIIKRQAAVDPFYDLSKISRKNLNYAKYYKQRLDFLQNFYQFAIDYLDGYSKSWSEWKIEKKTSYDL